MTDSGGSGGSGGSEWNGEVERDGPGHWFALNKLAYSLDIVTLLAIIGEKSMSDHAQPITASWLCTLPRLIPAPQAFLTPNRPRTLPHIKAKVHGVHSHVEVDSLSLFAESLLPEPLENMEKYSFYAVTIRHSEKVRRELTPMEHQHLEERMPMVDYWYNVQRGRVFGRLPVWLLKLLVGADWKKMKRGSSMDSSSSDMARQSDSYDPEANYYCLQPARLLKLMMGAGWRNVERDSSKDYDTKANRYRKHVESDELDTHVMFTKWDSPLRILTIVSFLVTTGLFIYAGVRHDGMGMIAIGVVGLSSSFSGLASAWQPEITTVPYSTKVPPGDIILSTRSGAHVYVRCAEPVARELFTGVHTCAYAIRSERRAQGLLAFATVLIMISVVFLGNCTWMLKVALGSVYIGLNLLYWVCSMFDRKLFWDLSRYEVYHWNKTDYQKPWDTIPAPEELHVVGYTQNVWNHIGRLTDRKTTRGCKVILSKSENRLPQVFMLFNLLYNLTMLVKAIFNLQILQQKLCRLVAFIKAPADHCKTTETNGQNTADSQDNPLSSSITTNPGMVKPIFPSDPEKWKWKRKADNVHTDNKDVFNKFRLRRLLPPQHDKLAQGRYIKDIKAHNKTVARQKSGVWYKNNLKFLYNLELYEAQEKQRKIKLENSGNCDAKYERNADFVTMIRNGRWKEANRLVEDEIEDDCMTRVVWYAIRASRQTEWAKSILPSSRAYKIWFRMVEERIAVGDWDWKAVNAKNAAMVYVSLEMAKLLEGEGLEGLNTEMDLLEQYLDGKVGVDKESGEEVEGVAAVAAPGQETDADNRSQTLDNESS